MNGRGISLRWNAVQPGALRFKTEAHGTVPRPETNNRHQNKNTDPLPTEHTWRHRAPGRRRRMAPINGPQQPIIDCNIRSLRQT